MLSTSRKEHEVVLLGRIGLLGQLPYEIRQMIYPHVFGNRLLHLTHIPGQRRIYHHECNFTFTEYHTYCLRLGESMHSQD